ncbi:MAG: hypothetical protein NZ900_00770 [Synergistetes bacterium]|nr:hypothetical protein [Synergistota bacterium]MDW8191459.1 hypothetical protein [Synergistota bacterium]
MGDWEFTSHFKAKKRYPGSSFGLILWDGGESKTYHLLFGPHDRDKLVLAGSLPKKCSLGYAFEVPFKSKEGLLKVRKSKNEISFYFKADLDGDWEFLGKLNLKEELFKYIGFFAKSIGEYSSAAEFYSWELKPALPEKSFFRIKDALFYGISDYDHVNFSEEIGPDGFRDGRFLIEVEGVGVAIKAIEVRGYGKNNITSWNTIPGDGIPAIAVLDKSGKFLNLPSGSINIPVKGEDTLNLYVCDSGVMTREEYSYKVFLWLSDGRKVDFPVKKEEIYKYPITVRECAISGIGSEDYVSVSEEIKGDSKPDLHLKLVLEGNGIITGIELYSTTNSLASWNTYLGDGCPVIAVTDENGRLLSAYDGSLYLKVYGRKVYNLWCHWEDSKSLDLGVLRIVLTLSNGMKIMAPVKGLCDKS